MLIKKFIYKIVTFKMRMYIKLNKIFQTCKKKHYSIILFYATMNKNEIAEENSYIYIRVKNFIQFIFHHIFFNLILSKIFH